MFDECCLLNKEKSIVSAVPSFKAGPHRMAISSAVLWDKRRSHGSALVLGRVYRGTRRSSLGINARTASASCRLWKGGEVDI